MDRNIMAQNADKLWVVEYDHAGATWALDDIYALDEEDARQKLRAIGSTGRVIFGPVTKRHTFTFPSPLVAFGLILLGGVVGVLAIVALG